jgi:hypothetical protein
MQQLNHHLEGQELRHNLLPLDWPVKAISELSELKLMLIESFPDIDLDPFIVDNFFYHVGF